MARVAFSKWQGTGNDFILVDDRADSFPSTDLDLVRRLCDRHFGIGSDGLILIQRPRIAGTAYHMEFFNPDGSQSFCGNGSRCAFTFWRGLNGDDPMAITGAHQQAWFTAIDGRHGADVRGAGEVGVTLHPPGSIERVEDNVDFIHTGSPHLLVWVDDPELIDIVPAAHHYRYGERFRVQGVNVNFVSWDERADRLLMRTYERGVETETLSCGTGVTAACLDAIHRGFPQDTAVEVMTRGGRLRVEAVFRSMTEPPSSVTLIGAVAPVFQGEFEI